MALLSPTLLAIALARIEAELPSGVILYRTPNYAPEGFIALGAHTPIVPCLKNDGSLASTKLVAFERQIDGKRVFAPVEFDDSETLASVIDRCRSRAKELSELKEVPQPSA